MSTPAPLNSNPTPVSTGEPTVAPGFEDRLHIFWINNAKNIYVACLVVLIVIIAKGGYTTYRSWQDEKIGQEYAAASSSEKLKAFATANAGHVLAGVAWLRLADGAYAAGKYTEAAQSYQSVVALKEELLVGRARLGLAISKLQGGQAVEAETQLKQIADDAKLMKGVRAEAAYQLASSASVAGRTDEALKYLDQVTSIEPAGTWAQRAMLLRITLPTPAAISSGSPAISPLSKP